nr:hypothetical protein Iba_chr05eCG2980 [Ipomoea batatas]
MNLFSDHRSQQLPFSTAGESLPFNSLSCALDSFGEDGDECQHNILNQRRQIQPHPQPHPSQIRHKTQHSSRRSSDKIICTEIYICSQMLPPAPSGDAGEQPRYAVGDQHEADQRSHPFYVIHHLCLVAERISHHTPKGHQNHRRNRQFYHPDYGHPPHRHSS